MVTINIRPFESNNIKLTYEWVQDKELQRLFTIRGEPDWETHCKYFERILNDETQALYAIYCDGYHIGNCGLKNMHDYECELWLYIGDKSNRGKGYGEKACREILDTARNKYKFIRIYLHVLADNMPAISMYKKLGFKAIEFNRASGNIWEKRNLDIVRMERFMARMDKYFIIGGGTLQYDFIETVKRMGYEAIVFDYNPKCPGASIADGFFNISIDKMEEILKCANEMKPVGIQTVATELGNLTACYVGEKMKLRTNTYETALNTTDKSRMKKIFTLNGIPSAKYIEATDMQEVDVENLPYPVVLKPADRSAGRGVQLVQNAKAFTPAFKMAKNEANNKIVIIEEFLTGQQFSVETISAESNHYVVMFTEEYLDGSDNFIEKQHLNPARMSIAQEKELTELIIRTLNVFDIHFGACHIEVLLTRDGFKVIEIASRMGGLRDKLAILSTECDYDELLVKVTTGQEFKIRHNDKYWALVKLMYNKKDYDYYHKLRKESPDLIVHDEVREMSRKDASCLMDATGFYYIRFDKSEDPDKYIKGAL